jgi:ankyrin repeat protein
MISNAHHNTPIVHQQPGPVFSPPAQEAASISPEATISLLETKIRLLETKIRLLETSNHNTQLLAVAAITAIDTKITRRFIECVQKGDNQKIGHLIAVLEDINAMDSRSGLTPLCAAVKYNRKEVVSFLLEQKADVQHLNPLRRAVRNGQTDIVKLFLKKDADNNCYDALLSLAIRKGHTDIVKLLLERGENRDKADRLLIMAIDGNHKDIVKLLLELYPNANLYNALSHAIREGQTKIVKFLLKHELDIDEIDNLLLIAKEVNHKDIVELLLAKKMQSLTV